MAIKAPRERELFVIGKRLMAKHQDGVRVHPCPNLSERLSIIYLTQVNRADLSSEVRVKSAKCQSHTTVFLPQSEAAGSLGFTACAGMTPHAATPAMPAFRRSLS